MCVSLPGEVVAIDGALALVETVGVRRWCNALAYPELQCGDRVLLHAGLVVRVLTDEEARATDAAFAELGVPSRGAGRLIESDRPARGD